MSRETGVLVQQLREEMEISESELARLLNVNKSTITKWEKEGQISIENLYKLSRLFTVSIQELINGKLDSEGNNEYFERNYNLNLLNLEEYFKFRDIEKIVAFYQKCLFIKKSYKILLCKKLVNGLSENESEEVEFLQRFIEVDQSMLMDVYYNSPYLLRLWYKNNNENRNREEILKFIVELPENERNWELDKIISFNIDLKINDAIEIGSVEIFKALVSLFTQIEKDYQLRIQLKESQKEDFKNLEFLKLLLEGGAKLMYTRRDFREQPMFDNEIVNQIEGNLKEYKNFNSFIDEKNYENNRYILDDNWRYIYYISYDFYNQIINKKKTDYYKDLYILKEKDPMQYYNNLIYGKYDF